jgi:Flp pilus assembly protein TadG
MEHKRTWKRASLRHWIKRYSRDEDGSIAIEMMLLLPMLFWAFLTLFSIFDAYRKHSMNQKAAFTIGDMISRETALVNQAYLNGTQQLLSYLTNADLSDTSIRITSVKYDPPYNTGLSDHEIVNFVFTRPRYAPQVLWDHNS